MEVTRKGYYTITGPDGELLKKPDGSLLRVTSRDECYERITSDDKEYESAIGTYTIHCPEREVLRTNLSHAQILPVDHVAETDSSGAFEADWSQRTSAYGTQRFNNFPTVEDTNTTENLIDVVFPANVQWESAGGISGNGLLKLHHPGTGGGESAGHTWAYHFFADEHSTVADEVIYVQFAVKRDANSLLDAGGSGRKTSIMAAPGSTFQDSELTQQDNFNRGYTQHYTSAGANALASSGLPDGSTFRRQTAFDRGWGVADVGDRYTLSNGIYGSGSNGALLNVANEWWHYLYRCIRRSDTLADIDIFIHRRGTDDGWLCISSDRDQNFGITDSFRSLHLLTYVTSGPVLGLDVNHRYDEVIMSTKMPPAPQSKGAPAWFEVLDALKWTEVGEAMNSASLPASAPSTSGDSGSRKKCFDAWTGPVMDEDRGELIFAANQGHGDGSYNGVLSITFKDENPAWTQVTEPSADPSEEFADAQMTSDDAAVSSHSYDLQCYCPSVQKFFFPGRGSIATGGQRREIMFTWGRYSRRNVDYVRGWDMLSYGGAFSMGWSGGSSDVSAEQAAAYDPVTERVIVIPRWNNALTNSAPAVIDPIQETISFTGTGNVPVVSGNPYPRLECAGSHGLACLLYGNGTLRVWDTQDLSSGYQVNFVPSGGPSLDQAPDFVWHEESDAFLVRGGTSRDLYKLRPDSWASWATDSQWKYTLVPTDVTGSIPDAHYIQGSHGKFRIIPDMGNSEACLVLIPKETSVPLVMRLTGAL